MCGRPAVGYGRATVFSAIMSAMNETQTDTPLRLEWMDPNDLTENPSQWRTHPESQLSALRAVLADVGWAGALLWNERTNRLVDGHGRKAVTVGQDEKVPVLVGDWSEEDEKKILATLDPLAAMAESDAGQLDALLREVQTDNQDLADMLTALAEEAGVTPPNFEPVGIDEQGQLDQKAPITCPSCGHEFTP